MPVWLALQNVRPKTHIIIFTSTNVRLKYDLPFLPNLLTKASQEILLNLSSKGSTLKFIRGLDERHIQKWEGAKIKWIYDANKSGFKFKEYGENAITKSGDAKDTVNIDKVVINFGGGIDSYSVKYIQKEEKHGVLDMSMYTPVATKKDGEHIQEFFKSPIVQFLFLITQYSEPPNTKNEVHVANSITIPPQGIKDYYKYFDIEEHKAYIEDILEKYKAFKAPKRAAKTAKAKAGDGGSYKPRNKTRKMRKL